MMAHRGMKITYRLMAAMVVLVAGAGGCDRNEAQKALPEPADGWVRPASALPARYREAWSLQTGLSELRDVACPADGKIIVVGDEEVRIYAERELETQWNVPAPPTSVAGRPGGGIYVAARQAVYAYDANGTLVSTWPGKDENRFNVITSVAAHDTNVYVADAGNRLVYRFDTTGDFMNRVGERTGPGRGLIVPSPHLDCVVRRDGMLWVTNPGRLRVELYRPDGELLDHWGKPGIEAENFFGCCNPVDLARFPNGDVAAGTKAPPSIKVYSPEGVLKAMIDAGHFSSQATFVRVAADERGLLYALDPGNGTVKCFAPINQE